MARKKSQWQITAPGKGTRGARVLHNGQEIHGIRRLKLDMADGEFNRLTLVIFPCCIEGVFGELELDIHPKERAGGTQS